MNWRCPACGYDENPDEVLHCICGHEIKESEIQALQVTAQDVRYSRLLNQDNRGNEQEDSSLLNSNLKQFVFLMIFLIGLGFMLSESDVGEFDRMLGIDITLIFPTFLILMGIINRRLSKSKKRYTLTALKDAVLCTAVTSLFIPTLNRLIPPSSDVTIKGRIIDIKPGRGAYVGVEIKTIEGKVLKLSAFERRVKAVPINQDIEWKLKRGGLGFIYGPRE